MRIETSQNVDPKNIPVDSNGMELPNLTALETVSQSKFWLLWTIFVAISIMSGFVNNYQKTFGMKFITDDFFFTYVGLASNLINGSSRIMWGYLHDLKGFKVIFIKGNCHNTIFNLLCFSHFFNSRSIQRRLIFSWFSIFCNRISAGGQKLWVEIWA